MGIRKLFAAGPTPEAQLHALVYGQVQGVGFRWWAASVAKPLHLVGYAKNLADGSVEIIAQGSADSCRAMLAELLGGDTAGRVDHVESRITAPTGSYRSFGMY